MTLDQVFMRLADRKRLKARSTVGGIKKAPSGVPTRADGKVRGRAADGTAIEGRIHGKSLARRLMEEQAEEEKKKPRRRRRKS